MKKINILLFLMCFFTGGGLSLPAYAQTSDPMTATFNFESSTSPYNWQVTAWNECEGYCFTGNQRRGVTCVDNAGNEADDESRCAHSEKPNTYRECVLPPCSWQVGAYGRCRPQDGEFLNECTM